MFSGKVSLCRKWVIKLLCVSSYIAELPSLYYYNAESHFLQYYIAKQPSHLNTLPNKIDSGIAHLKVLTASAYAQKARHIHNLKTLPKCIISSFFFQIMRYFFHMAEVHLIIIHWRRISPKSQKLSAANQNRIISHPKPLWALGQGWRPFSAPGSSGLTLAVRNNTTPSHTAHIFTTYFISSFLIRLVLSGTASTAWVCRGKHQTLKKAFGEIFLRWGAGYLF